MINGSDAADQVVRYTLEGTEIALKLSGLAAKNVAAFLIAILNESKKTRGKAGIERMLREGKPLKIFQIPTDQLKMFSRESKRYGFLFKALLDKRNPAPETDIMVFAKDAAKINRVLDRLSIAVVDAGAIESEIMEGRGENGPFVPASENPSEISSPSRIASTPGRSREEGGKPSVKKLLEELRQEGKKPPSRMGAISSRRISAPSARESPKRRCGELDGAET